MPRTKLLRYSLLLLLIGINVGCDQVSKSIVRDQMDSHQRIQVLGEHLTLTKVENTGAFLSAGDSLPPLAKVFLLTIFPVVTLLGMLFWLFSQQGLGRGTMFALCCVLGGGIGNVFDRVMYGSVTDFLYLEFGVLHTGIFNFADVSITGGVLMIVFLQLFQPHTNNKPA